MSSVDTEYTAIVTYWRANCPVAAARRDFSALGGPMFDRPKVDWSAITNANRLATLQALIWIRLGIQGAAGSGRPLGIDPNSKSHRIGLITQQVFFPVVKEGAGLDFVLPIVDTARAVFHRVSLSSGLVLCRDTDAPVRIHNPENTEAGWGQFNVVTPYWLREA